MYLSTLFQFFVFGAAISRVLPEPVPQPDAKADTAISSPRADLGPSDSNAIDSRSTSLERRSRMTQGSTLDRGSELIVPLQTGHDTFRVIGIQEAYGVAFPDLAHATGALDDHSQRAGWRSMNRPVSKDSTNVQLMTGRLSLLWWTDSSGVAMLDQQEWSILLYNVYRYMVRKNNSSVQIEFEVTEGNGNRFTWFLQLIVG